MKVNNVFVMLVFLMIGILLGSSIMPQPAIADNTLEAEKQAYLDSLIFEPGAFVEDMASVQGGEIAPGAYTYSYKVVDSHNRYSSDVPLIKNVGYGCVYYDNVDSFAVLRKNISIPAGSIITGFRVTGMDNYSSGPHATIQITLSREDLMGNNAYTIKSVSTSADYASPIPFDYHIPVNNEVVTDNWSYVLTAFIGSANKSDQIKVCHLAVEYLPAPRFVVASPVLIKP